MSTRFATEIDIAVAAELLNGLAENGGATINLDNATPVETQGYVVAYAREMTWTVTPTMQCSVTRNVQDVALQYAQQARLWVGDNDGATPLHVGVWADPDTGIVYFDVVQIFTDYVDAMDAARANGEIAIFDNVTGEDIKVPAVTLRKPGDPRVTLRKSSDA